MFNNTVFIYKGKSNGIEKINKKKVRNKMRATQVFGLKQEAIDFLDENVDTVPDLMCPKCGEVITHTKKSRVYENAKASGLHKDGPLLKEYILKDGRIVREVLSKYRPMSGWLCLFLDLVDEDKNVLYEWSEEEISRIV